jgi:hypothetical protein
MKGMRVYSIGGEPSPKRVPLATVEEVLRLYQEQYFDQRAPLSREAVRGARDQAELHLGQAGVAGSWIGNPQQIQSKLAGQRRKLRSENSVQMISAGKLLK